MTRPDTTMAGAGKLETARFCRVTVLAPRLRMDLALPTDLTIAELVPMLTDLAGETANTLSHGRVADSARGLDDTVVPSAWCLAPVAGAPLPPAATLGVLGVLDGDLLRLRRRADTPTPPVFDDPVDAVADVLAMAEEQPAAASHESTGARPALVLRPWNGRCRRVAGLTIAAVAVLLAAALLAAGRGLGHAANPVTAAIAGLVAIAALVGGQRAAQSDTTVGTLLTTSAVPFASIAGFAGLPGWPGAGHLLLATALAATTSAVGLTTLGAETPVLVAVLSAAVVGALSALFATFGVGGPAGPAGLAASAAAAAIGLLPLLPRVSARLAGLPPPVVPVTPEDLLAAEEQWPLDAAADVRYRARLAHAYLAGLVIAAIAVASVGAVWAATSSVGPAGRVFAGVVIAVLMLRSRAYVTAVTSAAPLVGGLLAATALAVRLAVATPSRWMQVAAVGLSASGAVAVTLVWSGRRHPASPVLRKAVDVIEVTLIVAVFPLALWTLDLYEMVRGL